jgi:NADH dehydrogenase
MFAPDDQFLTTLARLLRTSPIFPLFGMGRTRLQPVHVDDVAEAIARILSSAAGVGHLCYEPGGPRPYTYAELLRNITDRIGARARLLPVPFALWHATALVSETMLGAILTHGQVALMRRDNVASQELPGLRNLNIAPTALEDVVLTVAEGEAARH